MNVEEAVQKAVEDVVQDVPFIEEEEEGV